MKRILALLLAVCSLLILAACGEKAEAEPQFCEECSKEELMEMFDEPDPELRAKAAASCGRFDDLDFLPELETILNSPDEAGLHAAALKSLEMLWYDPPRYENIHQEAFELLSAYLEHEPGEPLPDIQALMPFTEKVQEKWLLTAIWFDRDELVLQLEKLLEDPACDGSYKESVEQAVKV